MEETIKTANEVYGKHYLTCSEKQMGANGSDVFVLKGQGIETVVLKCDFYSAVDRHNDYLKKAKNYERN